MKYSNDAGQYDFLCTKAGRALLRAANRNIRACELTAADTVQKLLEDGGENNRKGVWAKASEVHPGSIGCELNILQQTNRLRVHRRSTRESETSTEETEHTFAEAKSPTMSSERFAFARHSNT